MSGLPGDIRMIFITGMASPALTILRFTVRLPLEAGRRQRQYIFYIRKGSRCRKGLPSVQSNMYCRGLRWLCLEGQDSFSVAPI